MRIIQCKCVCCYTVLLCLCCYTVLLCVYAGPPQEEKLREHRRENRKRKRKGKSGGEEEEGEEDVDPEMASMMGFSDFGTKKKSS